MKKCYIPSDYSNPLSVYETQCAIEFIKHNFQKNLCSALNLLRVSAPLFVEEASGLNDNLNGYERPVSFDVPDVGTEAQVVHSLAKWKRYALDRYDFRPGKGLVTDMNAIRRDEVVDNIHSVYVDQWDWEKVITRETRNLDTLKDVVQRIVNAVYVTCETLKIEYPQLSVTLPREVLFVTTQELEDRFPELTTAAARETAFHRENRDKAIFLMQIGGALRSGKPHDGRAPDYDDWSLNGDILFWNDVLDRSFEVSSMGIRVDSASLDAQLTISGCDNRRELPFHRALLNDELPLTIGGGIGQSRLCMLLLGCCHIGEVQSSVWDAETVATCSDAGVKLL
ncbi:MAG: aspartate--ammonia ligase [Oscillospiraceae bacterium]|jgi:aspartate--ammonia ligase|nr:aspartate--ammonia ligase [Oscillospiraceae bacterium]